MVKKLRYYARFIVVCLLLKKMKLVRDLVRELSKHIDDYTATYEPEDQLEWTLVLGEIKSFIEADTVVNVLDSDSNSIVLSHRLNPLITPPVEKSPIMTLSLQGGRRSLSPLLGIPRTYGIWRPIRNFELIQ